MLHRLIGALVVLLLAVPVLAAPAAATEAQAEGEAHEQSAPRNPEELGSQSDVAREFMPEDPEPPAFFRFMYYPLLIVAVLAVTLVLFRYLQWQPLFARERRGNRRR